MIEEKLPKSLTNMSDGTEHHPQKSGESAYAQLMDDQHFRSLLDALQTAEDPRFAQIVELLQVLPDLHIDQVLALFEGIDDLTDQVIDSLADAVVTHLLVAQLRELNPTFQLITDAIIPSGDPRFAEIEAQMLGQGDFDPQAISETIKGMNPAELAETVDELLQQILAYLAIGIVEDGFGTDDTARDAFEAQAYALPQRDIVKKLIEENRLRPNRMFLAISYLQQLVEYFIPEGEIKTKLAERVAFVNQAAYLRNQIYKMLSLPEKLMVVNQLVFAIKHMLFEFADDTSAQGELEVLQQAFMEVQMLVETRVVEQITQYLADDPAVTRAFISDEVLPAYRNESQLAGRTLLRQFSDDLSLLVAHVENLGILLDGYQALKYADDVEDELREQAHQRYDALQAKLAALKLHRDEAKVCYDLLMIHLPEIAQKRKYDLDAGELEDGLEEADARVTTSEKTVLQAVAKFASRVQ